MCLLACSRGLSTGIVAIMATQEDLARDTINSWHYLPPSAGELSQCTLRMQGEWLCADCVAGRPTKSRHAPRNPRLLFQAARLGMVRIEKLWEIGGTARFSGRWYCRPEDTEAGRQVGTHDRYPTWMVMWGCLRSSQAWHERDTLQHQADISFGDTLKPAPDKPAWSSTWQAQHWPEAIAVLISHALQLAARCSKICGYQALPMMPHISAMLALRARELAVLYPHRQMHGLE